MTNRPRQPRRTRWTPLTRRLGAALVGGALLLPGLLQVGPMAQASTPTSLAGQGSGWVGTWGTAPVTGLTDHPDVASGHTLRQVVHVSAGGSAVRVRLSNRFNDQPQVLDHVTVAVQSGSADSPDAVPRSMREVRFRGKRSVTLAPGQDRQSDPVALPVLPDSNLLITSYVSNVVGKVTVHHVSKQVNFYAATGGDHAAEPSGAAFTGRTLRWSYLAGVDVFTPSARGTIVALGDSITDGNATTDNANRRWPDVLSDRIQAALPRSKHAGVVNSGISGNRLLLDGSGVKALDRLDADVLSRTNVRTVIVFMGINDIQQTPHQTDPTKLEAAYREIADRAHARGIKVIGATITPFKGWRVWDETLEATRQAANDFIRTTDVFDAVVDFDAAVRDPADPLRLLPAYDIGDGLHPNDAGCKAMADAIDLSLL